MVGIRIPKGIGFERLIEPIRLSISDFYWVFGDINVWSPEDHSIAEAFLSQESNPSASKGLITNFSSIISGDWDKFCGAPTVPPLKGFGRELIDQWAYIIFSCIDASHWEVFSKDAHLLEPLRAVYPSTGESLINNLKLDLTIS